ncbi:hypothetical protein QMA09_07860 [Planococcus sp. APC 3906]|uniref:hypothetical protein n=1 Tax=Planococcus sp. APC 3906 TaxID=3035194 RepID=UPI0025B3127A|nr:hypothetical protein [Planococcus sp. APC 3906]MDN3450102.1 hypothetical protein [Planococcus sp. APC 3906]
MELQIIDELKNRTYKKNLFATDFVVRSAYMKNNLQVERKIKEFSDVDSVQSVGQLKEKVKSFENVKNIYGTNCIGSESLLYGHIHALYDYAGLPVNKPLLLPKMEHGVNFSESPILEQDIKAYPNRIFQGSYKKGMVHSASPLTPVFCIGPYIHYASNYYTEDQIRSIKMKNGKTLLVFPTHTYESSSMDYDLLAFVDNVMNGYGKAFDTILVSGYWLNLNSKIYELFEERGAIIVSAGARFDPNFLRRLKTIISLSDMVIGNDVGTHIGYSLHLNKPFQKVSSKIVKKDSFLFSATEEMNMIANDKLFTAAFGSGEETSGDQLALFKKFWGGPEFVKTPEEIRNLIMLAQKHLDFSRGSIKRYDAGVLKLWRELKGDQTVDGKMQFKILKEAININKLE